MEIILNLCHVIKKEVEIVLSYVFLIMKIMFFIIMQACQYMHILQTSLSVEIYRFYLTFIKVMPMSQHVHHDDMMTKYICLSSYCHGCCKYLFIQRDFTELMHIAFQYWEVGIDNGCILIYCVTLLRSPLDRL